MRTLTCSRRVAMVLLMCMIVVGAVATAQTKSRTKKKSSPRRGQVDHGRAGAGRFAPSATFHLLLIVKPLVDISVPTFLPVRNRMSAEDIRAVSRSFREHLPDVVSIRTEGRVKVLSDVVVSDLPLRTTNVTTDRQSGHVWAEDLYDDVDRFAPVGAYDSLFYYYKHIDDATGYVIPRTFGIALTAQTPSANYAGQSSINWAAGGWTRESHSYEVFLHEWLHQLEGFYGERGVRLPKGGLHGGEVHGYESTAPNYWEPWYTDFLNGQVRENGEMTGLGEAAWRHGTIREAALLRPPPGDRPPQRMPVPPRHDVASWLKPAGIARFKARFNLLSDPSFERTDGPWTFASWRNRPESQKHVDLEPHDGAMAVAFDVENDAASLSQKVKVKTYTNYLLAGWVRTEKLLVTEAGGTIGAHLEVMAVDRNQGKSILGTRPWTYIVTAFYTGPKTEVEVAVQVGGHASVVTGKAWFDDLCLLEIGD